MGFKIFDSKIKTVISVCSLTSSYEIILAYSNAKKLKRANSCKFMRKKY